MKQVHNLQMHSKMDKAKKHLRKSNDSSLKYKLSAKTYAFVVITATCIMPRRMALFCFADTFLVSQ
jgi:hypothetical protein